MRRLSAWLSPSQHHPSEALPPRRSSAADAPDDQHRGQSPKSDKRKRKSFWERWTRNPAQPDGGIWVHVNGVRRHFTPGAVLAELHTACRRGDVETAERLTHEVRARDINRKLQGTTALHLAVFYCGRLSLVNTLLDRGADPNAVDILGWSVLLAAAAANRMHLIRTLLEAGADPTARSRAGSTLRSLVMTSFVSTPMPRDRTAIASGVEDLCESIAAREALSEFDFWDEFRFQMPLDVTNVIASFFPWPDETTVFATTSKAVLWTDPNLKESLGSLHA